MKTNSYNSNLPGLILIALLALALIAACSGGNIDVAIGGINVPPGTVPPLQNSEPLTAQGAVTGLGDLTVNGVRYSAAGASIIIDSEPGTLSDLRIGHIVTISGRIGNAWTGGTASWVRMHSRVTGPIEAIDATGRRLLVMGQPVRLGPDTQYPATIDADTLDGLATGDIVRISGHADAAGAIRATRVEHAASNSPLAVIGEVAALDIGNLTFTVNQLTVDYGNAVLIDLPGGAPANGMMVKAIGTLSNGLFAVEQLVAAPAFTGSSGRRAQLDGLVTRFESLADFAVGDTDVTANAGTAFSNGDAGDLALDAEVVIDGDFAAGGRIVANRISFGQLAGTTRTLVYGLQGFTEISVPTVFGISVTQGADYSVEVTVDAEAADRVSVDMNGARLTIALQTGDGRIDTLEAHVTMPVLDRIDLTGVVDARLYGFDQPQMTINVGGVSNLRGEALTVDHLIGSVSGVSRLQLGDIRPIGRADITVGGVSQATLNMDVGATLAGSVTTGQGTGASTLFYYGTNVVMNVATGPNASVIRLGDTKP